MVKRNTKYGQKARKEKEQTFFNSVNEFNDLEKDLYMLPDLASDFKEFGGVL